MGLEVTTALVALVVSLIALLIASLQLVQALFGTAEGYKRCSRSVIGSWEGLRRRYFLPSELRFEVLYMTPQILLVSQEAKRWLEDKHLENCTAENQGPVEHVCILHQHNIDKIYKEEQRKKCEWEENASRWHRHYHELLDWLSRHYNPWEYHNKMRILFTTARGHNFKQDPSTHPEEIRMEELARTVTTYVPPLERGVQRRPTHLRSAPVSSPGPDYEMRVTWDIFLKAITNVYTQYPAWTPEVPRFDVHTAIRYANHAAISDARHLYLERNWARTHAAVMFRQWSWDMMPADMTRPLATIAISHLVILAVRLGMQWRSINLETGMSADGHGYSLSSTRSDKLGLVFKLIAFGPDFEPQGRLIPSKSADKLICGMLPGCNVLVNRDFNLIDNDRRSILDLRRAQEPDHVLDQIGLPEKARLQIKGAARKWSLPSIHNEIVPLLCAFLPIEGVSAVRHYTHCWLERRKSVLHLWEGRYVLLYRLRQTLRVPRGVHHSHSPQLITTYDYLEHLMTDYPQDFFGLKDDRAIDGPHGHSMNPKAAERRNELIALCRKIHRWTDDCLKNMGFAKEDAQGRTHYQNLVAAHINMAIHSTTSIYSNAKRQTEFPSCPLSVEKIPRVYEPILREVLALGDDTRPPWVLCQLLEEAQRYVHYMACEDHSVAKYLRERGLTCSVSEIETAWWILMLRGIAWNMSTIDHCWGEPIPASFYDNHVPAWMT